jgi:hypothetical protein
MNIFREIGGEMDHFNDCSHVILSPLETGSLHHWIQRFQKEKLQYIHRSTSIARDIGRGHSRREAEVEEERRRERETHEMYERIQRHRDGGGNAGGKKPSSCSNLMTLTSPIL